MYFSHPWQFIPKGHEYAVTYINSTAFINPCFIILFTTFLFAGSHVIIHLFFLYQSYHWFVLVVCCCDRTVVLITVCWESDICISFHCWPVTVGSVDQRCAGMAFYIPISA